MARVELQCICGEHFSVSDAQKGPPRCPSCGELVGASKPAPAAEPHKKKQILLIAGGMGALLVVGIVVVVVLVMSGSSNPYEKQAEREMQERKSVPISTKPEKKEVTPAPAVAKAAPAPTTPPAPPPRSEPRPLPPPPPKVPASATAPAPVPQGPAVAPLSSELLQKIRSELLALHPFYLNLVITPAERTRADVLLASGKGNLGDSEFLQGLMTTSKLRAVREEIDLIQQTLPTLEREAQEGLPVDKVTLADGRVMNCRILEEGVEIVKVERRLAGGVGGQLPLRRDNIKSIEKGKGIGTDFPARYDASQKGTLADQVALLTWCKDNNLSGQAKLICYRILKSDPSNVQARNEMGMPADPVKLSEDKAAGAVIVYQGKNWTPKELREKFTRDGYVLLNGAWFSKKERMIVVPGLFRYERQQEKPVIFGGSAPLSHDIETTYKVVQEMASNSFVEQPETKFVRRFYAPGMIVNNSGRPPPGIAVPGSTPEVEVQVRADDGTPTQGTPMKGELSIQVPIGATILEASVMTAAEVRAGGSITVYLVTGPGEGDRVKLYQCDPKEGSSHPIPTELIRGAKEVQLVAVIESVATYATKVERRRVRGLKKENKVVIQAALDIVHYRLFPDYKAVLFPSTSNTFEVFRLKVATADPAPQLDKVFASNPEALK